IVAADARIPHADESLRSLPLIEDVPLTLAVDGPAQAVAVLPGLPPLARWLARRCWPGPVTLLAAYVSPNLSPVLPPPPPSPRPPGRPGWARPLLGPLPRPSRHPRRAAPAERPSSDRRSAGVVRRRRAGRAGGASRAGDRRWAVPLPGRGDARRGERRPLGGGARRGGVGRPSGHPTLLRRRLRLHGQHLPQPPGGSPVQEAPGR